MPRGAFASFVLLASLLAAQDQVQPERWIVHFRQRSFDLGDFRAAIQGRAPAAEVDRVVRDLERKAQDERAGFRKAVERMGGTVRETWWLIDAAAVTIPQAAREALAALPEVARLEADRLAVPLGPIVTSTNLRNHNAEEVRTFLGILGNGVGVAVLDTGLDSSFAGDGRPHPTYYRDGNRSNHSGPGVDGSFLLANLQVGAVGPDDVNDHGTGVSGVIGAWKWNTDSYSGNGHAPESRKVGYCIADNAGGGSYFSTITTAWQRVAADKVRYGILAANNSYSGSPYAPDASQQALDAVALNADVMVCVAAGNDGVSSANSQSCANGLAVGATNPNDRRVTSFSSRGPLSGDAARFYPDLSAIGAGVVMPRRDVQDGAYVASGTSFASPQVCGAACLVRAANPGLSALQTKAILLAASEDVSAQNPGLDRNAFGVGWLRSDLAVKRALAAGQNPVGQITTATSPVRLPLAVTAGQGYTVALAWHRTNLGSNTWSNLDLRVLDASNVQVAAAATTRNLYERVAFTATSSGTWTVEVAARSLDAPSVTFALSMGPAGAHYVSGAFTPFGTGCAGTAAATSVVLPIAATQTFASSQSSMPFGEVPCRYQQVFPGRDVPRGLPIGVLAFRQDENAGAAAGATVDLEILIGATTVGSSRVDLQACKLEYSIVSPK